MSNVTIAEAKSQFSDLVRRAESGGERVLVHRHGRPVAAIVSPDDLRRLEALEDREDVVDAVAALREADAKGLVPLEVVLERHGLTHLLVRPESSPGPVRPTRTKKVPARRRSKTKTSTVRSIR